MSKLIPSLIQFSADTDEEFRQARRTGVALLPAQGKGGIIELGRMMGHHYGPHAASNARELLEPFHDMGPEAWEALTTTIPFVRWDVPVHLFTKIGPASAEQIRQLSALLHLEGANAVTVLKTLELQGSDAMRAALPSTRRLLSSTSSPETLMAVLGLMGQLGPSEEARRYAQPLLSLVVGIENMQQVLKKHRTSASTPGFSRSRQQPPDLRAPVIRRIFEVLNRTLPDGCPELPEVMREEIQHSDILS